MTGEPVHVAITGGSSGIGAALALAYARPGVRLALAGRDRTRLAAAAHECRAAGSEVAVGRVDVRDRDATRAWIDAAQALQPIDRLLCCAGRTGGTSPAGEPESPQTGADILATNVGGVVNAAVPALEHMLARGRGRLAILRSLAALVPLVTTPSYCASERAVAALGHGLARATRSRGVGVCVVYAGFLDTPMTRRLLGPKPGCVPVERAARLIRDGVEAGRERIVFPRLLGALSRALACLPGGLTSRITRATACRVLPP